MFLKAYFTLFTVSFVSFFSNAQTVVLNEDFQQGIPTDWTIIVNDTNTLQPVVASFDAGWISLQDPIDQTDTVIGASSYFLTQTPAERWIFTPAIDLLSFGNYVTWNARSHDPSYPENYKVLVGTAPSIASMQDTLALVLGEYHEWSTYEANLSELGFDNQSVYIGFCITTTDGFKLYLDDIQVRGNDPVGLTEITQAKQSLIYPNPTKHVIQVKGSIQPIACVNSIGQEITGLDFSNKSIDVSELVAGAYYLIFPNGQREKLLIVR